MNINNLFWFRNKNCFKSELEVWSWKWSERLALTIQEVSCFCSFPTVVWNKLNKIVRTIIILYISFQFVLNFTTKSGPMGRKKQPPTKQTNKRTKQSKQKKKHQKKPNTHTNFVESEQKISSFMICLWTWQQKIYTERLSGCVMIPNILPISKAKTYYETSPNIAKFAFYCKNTCIQSRLHSGNT